MNKQKYCETKHNFRRISVVFDTDAPRYLIRPLGYVQLLINRSMYFSKKEQPIIEAKLIIEFIQNQ